MKAIHPLSSGLRPLLLLGAAATAAALPVPEILHQEAEKAGLHLTVDVTRGQGTPRQVLLMVTVENRGDLVHALPGGPRENGLGFRLRDHQGRLLEDAAPPSFTEEVRLLSPGARLRSVIDLSARPLRRRSEDHVFEGLADRELALLPYFDLEVTQVAEGGALTLETPALRIWSNPYILHPLFMRQAAAFRGLHSRGPDLGKLPVSPGTPRPWPFPGLPETAPGRARPLQVSPGGPSLELPAYVAGELLVGFRPGVTRERAAGLVQDLGLEVKSDNLFQGLLRILVVRVPEGQEAEFLDTLGALDEVEWSERNHTVEIMS